jgi:hypothetical protein
VSHRRRTLSPRDFAALNRKAPIGVRYPSGGGPTELRVPSKRQRRRQRKGEEPTRAHASEGMKCP